MNDNELVEAIGQAMELLVESVQVLAHYRSRVHLPVDDGYLRIATNVSADAADAADRIVNAARKAGLITKEDKYQ